MGKKPNILEHNLDYIKDSISRNIGDFQNSGAGYVARLYAEADQADAWFKKDVSRRKYGNYMDYAEKMYFDNQVWTPFVNGVNYVNDLGNYLYPQTNYPDTHLGDVSQSALMHNIAHSMYTYYTTRTENGNQTVNAAVTKRKSITNWVAQCFSLEGYLEKGVRIAVDPMTGFIADLRGYQLSDLQNSDIDDIQRYGEQAGIDPWTEICYTSKEHCIPEIQRAYAEGQIITDTGVLRELSQNVIDTIKKAVSYNQYNLLGNGEDTTYGKYSWIFAHKGEATASFKSDDNGIHRVVDTHIAEGTGPEGNYDKSEDDAFDVIEDFDESTPHSLLDKTRALFKANKSNTLLARFCTGPLENDTLDPSLQSATSQFGLSHGRNLLKKDPAGEKTNGYANPYCRVWTFHHQYDRFNKTIRPIDPENPGQISGLDEVRAHGSTQAGGYEHDGTKYLTDNTVLDYKTNLVNITPKVSNGDTPQKQDLKRCMFSIENLAWRDVSNNRNGMSVLSPDQRGPFGGRIMWFPPYGLNFSEQTNVEYSSTSFIGRGEKIHGYVDSERSGQLSFKLLADHPSIVDIWRPGAGNTDAEGDLLRFFAGCGELVPNAGEKSTIVVTKDPKTPPTKNQKYIQFFVFFPNNYTGIDDLKRGKDYPIMYLLNGVGTQEAIQVNSDGSLTTGVTIPIDKIYNDTSSVSAITIGSSGEVKYKHDNVHYKTPASTGIGGYEMSADNSRCLSQIVQNTAMGYSTSGYTVQFSGTGTPVSDKQLAQTFELVERDGSYYMVQGIVGGKDHYNASAKCFTPGLWCYRIDERYKGVDGEKLVAGDAGRYTDYADTTSYGLNSRLGFSRLSNFSGGTNCTLVSLSDVAKAIMKEEVIGDLKASYYDGNSVPHIKSILSNYTVTHIQTIGCASKQGKVERNEKLSRDRGEMVKQWLEFNLPELAQTAAFMPTTTRQALTGTASQNNNTDQTKLSRSTEVRLYYTEKSTYEQLYSEDEKILKDLGIVLGESKEVTGDEYSNIQEAFARLKGKYTITRTTESVTPKQTTGGYGNEYRFFKKYTPDTKFYQDVKSKISNFYPVFHSVSPEGFNSRLTFLNQCTRQGPTQGGDGNAYNLAFGRPPICILRIGDFYYTKILITSLSINFDNAPWDLNPEGIGVQPMIADVTMSFKYLGGSTLEGPIARLQNATSSNYYANAGVYDLNAEEVIEYEEDTPNNEVINPANIVLNTKNKSK